ncbi:GNAT family N-acetyltransferase [Brochothrix thermosphacta]|uniref:GNAT family N-acetyltransferase n=1 Tax=Brochothrix thermosphacta TaxID=2756 RepID=UPI002712930C|nr:GNAT family N-acetyltransferase [Brochothrix thermosphacta]MDO7863221.1 GNAT family N-acetyltransferase [Brochothrix thermosphacta]
MNYELITDYKHNAIYRKSFFELVQTTFELDFKQWDDAGGWNDNYRCLSYRLGSQIVANVSINELTVIVEGNAHSALQIGTVVTHPDHRNKGLSRQLIEYALTTYEKDYDFIYLFANDTVLSFYPKFGFKQWHESTFFLDVSTYEKSNNTNSWRKLTREVPADLEIMTRLAEQRKPLIESS